MAGTLIIILCKIPEKKEGKIFKFFLLDTLKTTFRMVNLTQGCTQSGHFFLKSGHFFFIFKKGQGRPPPPPPPPPRPSCAPKLSIN